MKRLIIGLTMLVAGVSFIIYGVAIPRLFEPYWVNYLVVASVVLWLAGGVVLTGIGIASIQKSKE